MDARTLAWFFFGLSGRVNRAAYILAGLLLAVLQLFLLYRATLALETMSAPDGWASAFWLVMIVSLWCNFALSVKRVHDFGRPGVVAASVFVPVLAVLAFVVLCFIPGDKGPNAYGSRTNAPKD